MILYKTNRSCFCLFTYKASIRFRARLNKKLCSTWSFSGSDCLHKQNQYNKLVLYHNYECYLLYHFFFSRNSFFHIHEAQYVFFGSLYSSLAFSEISNVKILNVLDKKYTTYKCTINKFYLPFFSKSHVHKMLPLFFRNIIGSILQCLKLIISFVFFPKTQFDIFASASQCTHHISFSHRWIIKPEFGLKKQYPTIH